MDGAHENDDSPRRASAASPLCPLRSFYGKSAFAKRRRMTTPSGVWFAVLFARESESPVAATADGDRARVTCTSHIGSLFIEDGTAPPAPVAVAVAPPSPYPSWKVVSVLGPLRGENDANDVCRLWSLGADKIARADVISFFFGIMGFVEWDALLGAEARLAGRYRLEFSNNPFSDESEADGTTTTAVARVCRASRDRKKKKRRV